MQRWQRLRERLGVVYREEVRTENGGRFLPLCALPSSISLRQRERNRADGEEQKQVKRASNKICLNGGVDLFFHEVVPVEGGRSRKRSDGSIGDANMWRSTLFSETRKSSSRVF